MDTNVLFIFILAIFVGFEVVSKVPSMLHTPLMSGTNAIHGIIYSAASWCSPTPIPRSRKHSGSSR